MAIKYSDEPEETVSALRRSWKGWGSVAVITAVVLGYGALIQWRAEQTGRYGFGGAGEVNSLRLNSSEVAADFSEIEPGLYLGGSVRVPPAGTQAVLNLCEVKDPYAMDVERWAPIHDGSPAPSLEWLRKQVTFIDAERKAGRSVYVHCYAGISRGGMMTAAYLMWRDGLTRDEALTAVRLKRAKVSPNAAFMELLKEWEKDLKEAGKTPALRSKDEVEVGAGGA